MAIEGKKINELDSLTTVTGDTVLPVVYVSGQTISETAQKVSISQISNKVQNDLSDTLALKQDKLTAGAGIEISNTNVITATGSDVAVDNETIIQNQDSTITTIAIKEQHESAAIKQWVGAKAQYEAIQNKDDDTLYVITDDTSEGGGTDLTKIDGYNPSFFQLLVNDKGTFRFKQMLTSYYNFTGSNYISANEALPSFTNMISLCHIEIEKRTTSDPYYYQGCGQAFISNSNHSKSISFNLFDTTTDLQKLELYNGSSSVDTDDLALGSGVNRYWFKLVSNSSGDITLYYINDTSSMIPQPSIDSADWIQSISLASMFTTGETILFGFNSGDGYAPIRTKLLEGRIILDGDVFLDTQDTSTFTITGDMLEKVYFN